MVSCPRIGQVVQIWYRDAVRALMPHHGKVGRVVLASRGRPRNHMVEVDSCERVGEHLAVTRVRIVVPAGNLMAWPPKGK